MLTLLVIVAVGAVGYLSAAAARERGAPLQSMSITAVRLAVGIAVARLVILYSGLSLLGNVNPIRPVVFLLLVANSALEWGVAAVFYGGRPLPSLPLRGVPPLLVAVLICLTSVLLGFAWAWVRSRQRSEAAA